MVENPPYEATVRSHAVYLRQERSLSPWLAVDGFTLETATYDLLHLLYQGTARDHCASMLFYLKIRGCHYVQGETDEEYLRRTNLEMKTMCRAHGSLSCIEISRC